jgi:ABC-type antimicrobial peptide transport system permease subunit
MSAKAKKLDFRTVLYILIIVIIIAAIVYLLTLPPGKKVYSPEEVLLNKEDILGTTITVEGTYYISPDGPSFVSSTTATNPTNWLLVDDSGVDDTSPDLTENIKYQVTGVLERIEGDTSLLLNDVILVISHVDPV